jgi:hypothetical protein
MKVVDLQEKERGNLKLVVTGSPTYGVNYLIGDLLANLTRETGPPFHFFLD